MENKNNLKDFNTIDNKNNNQIWTEKYRPKTFDEFYGQDEIIKKIRAFVKQKNMPHLLFSGPAGIGKTSLALVIARELFGENWRSNILELNASDERGIDIIRNKVKEFARTRAISNVPFKIIYLDESDALTKEAQQALRRTMENYTKTCRFILSCNYSSKIIEPIQSRCAIFRFKPLPKEAIFDLIDKIVKKEGLKINKESKELLYEISEGDCRKLENILQSIAVITKDINEKSILAVASFANPKDIEDIIKDAINAKFFDARKKLFETMYEYGLSGFDVIKQIQSIITKMDLSNKLKLKIIEKAGEIEFRLVEGSNEAIQLESFLSYITLISNEKEERE